MDSSLYSDALRNKLRAVGDFGTGLGETALTLGSGALAQVPAGIAGIGDFLVNPESIRNPRHALERAAQRSEDTADYWTYSPRSDMGQRAVGNVGEGLHAVTEPLARYTVDPIGERSPALGAALLAGTNLIGPKGSKGATRAAETAAEHIKPRYDPGSFQQLIPGIEPHSLEQAHARAIGDLNRAREGMTFEDMNRGLRFEYDPQWRGGGEHYTMDYRGGEDADPSHGAERMVGRISQRPVPIAALEVPSSRTVPKGEFSGEGTVQAEVGMENFQQMLERLARLRASEDETFHIGEQAANTRSRELTEQLARRRALLQEPDLDAPQRLRLEEEILNKMRRLPIEVGGRTLVPQDMRYRDLWGVERQDEAQAYLREHPALDAQTRIVRRLRGEPEPPPVPVVRQPREPRLALDEVAGRDPNAMNREAVNAFLTGARTSPELFQYGLEPPANVRSLEDFAQHFGEKGDMDIGVDMSYGDSDEPSKIKTEKTHGRGEVMRDRYGDYKYVTHESGDSPMYDDRGNVKKIEKEKELAGPPEEGEDYLTGTKEVKREAEGGELVYTDAGDPEMKKSRGGEPVRDESGNIKEQWEDNPDYSGSETDVATISSPHGEITVHYDDPASITATSAGKKGGALLYQVALAHAAREGLQIGGGGLTDINSYRLLGNTLSNLARMGKNPRDVGGTQAGLAQRARGYAKGPEVWRADAEEARSRLLEYGADPDRVKFDPESGYSVDGQPATPDDIKMKIGDLSPRAGSRGGGGGVGQKSLMRNAVFEWLRNATPEEAQKVAAKWPKEWGPIFAGVGALGLGVGALQSGEQEKTD